MRYKYTGPVEVRRTGWGWAVRLPAGGWLPMPDSAAHSEEQAIEQARLGLERLQEAARRAGK